ncbi:MAG: TonB-dependent receptor [Rhodospirillaceae bacterium]|nr:TonB-dependent receptor [Rhodospirillaceae bacterium]MYB12117.1 TonB-dependent receptor [Rhodospirillaceae bacterium]MYI48374.1 TonB-dependent receptor [Rhodospirillaceae bacterium]
MRLESKSRRRDRKVPHRWMLRRSLALWCLAAALSTGLAGNAAHAGSLAPAPRVIATYERDFLERSGSQTLEELLETGIVRYFLTGGQPLLVLVNGRPYGTTAGDLDTLPISAIERIELLGGDSLGTLGGSAVRGAINVVLHKDLDGFETRAVGRMPVRDGGDGWQGSVFWGGAVGKGRMTLGIDMLGRQEIAARSRSYSRSAWQEGGTFGQAKNVSIGGNTVWVVQPDGGGGTTVRSVALGDCDPAKGYTGPLGNPPGARPGDKGCGFAYGNIMWNTSSYEQKSLILNAAHPLDDKTELRLDANIAQGASSFRYAPSVDIFAFTPSPQLISAINEAADGAFVAGGNDGFAVGHRFIGHGNRDWHTKSEEYDISVGVEGRFTEWLGYAARIDAYRLDGSVSGNTFVHAGRIRERIADGSYDLANPLWDAPEHREAIAYSSLREEIDFGSENLGGRLALEGSGFAIGGRKAAWTVGVGLGRTEAHSLLRFRSRDGMTHPVTDVLGSGGTSYAGKRRTVGAFAEMSLPLADNLDLRIAGRHDRANDVGSMKSWSLGVSYRPIENLTLRSSWSVGQRPPSMSSLHSTADQDHPYISCDPGTGDPPRSCTSPNPRQVGRETAGNPKLDPSDTKRFAIGVEARKRPYFLGVEWYRLSRTDLAGRNSADWAVRNLEECEPGNRSNCIDRTGGAITIYDSYANIVDVELTGVTVRFGGGFRTSWGIVGARGAWRHVTGAKRRVAGRTEGYAVPKNMVRAGFLARRGNLSLVWTSNYRSGFENAAGTGKFDAWFGHDAVLDWKAPMGLNGARLTAGVFNLTDAPLSVNTANPGSVDGPTEAGWGRTFFVTLNARF